MEEIFKYIHKDLLLIIISIINIILLLLYIINTIKVKKLEKRLNRFIKNIGNGNNIEEELSRHMIKVEEVSKENNDIKQYIKDINENVTKCIQKVGIVRYNAFKDTGSDLSFTLALLNKQNNGVVLNGIYSRDISNIYAKPIINGESTYKVTPEEQEAINKAISEKI